ncbi:MAG: hypothetical protein CL887_02680 [Dehalococcoidia bacterium]|nr:hypothetical protein [Dehalococcoidia bacterium]
MKLCDLIINHIDDPYVGIGQLSLECAFFEYPDLDVNAELQSFASLCKGIESKMEICDSLLSKANTLSEYLFDEIGFKGNNNDYYDPKNSFINEVLTRRLGIPISLSVIYAEVASRLGFECVPVGTPGHLILKITLEDGSDYFIDSFNRGIVMSEREAMAFIKKTVGFAYDVSGLKFDPISRRDLVLRLFTNVKYIYLRNSDYPRAYKVLDIMVNIDPNNVYEVRDRGLVGLRVGERDQSIKDFQNFLEVHPVGRSAVEISGLIDMLLKGQ